LFSQLDREFAFTLDACTTAENNKSERFFSPYDNGLSQRWEGRVWCNPRYGRAVGQWVKKAWQAALSGEAELVVCLLPARVDTAWWHDFRARGEVRFLRGRLRFGAADSGAPFPSAAVVFRNASARYETGTKSAGSLMTPADLLQALEEVLRQRRVPFSLGAVITMARFVEITPE
jgi:phage N-6-adenine-methyltransferase